MQKFYLYLSDQYYLKEIVFLHQERNFCQNVCIYFQFNGDRFDKLRDSMIVSNEEVGIPTDFFFTPVKHWLDLSTPYEN